MQKAASSDAASLNLAALSRLERGRVGQSDDSGVTLTWNKLVAVTYENVWSAPLLQLQLSNNGVGLR